jgi:hypothetical protein
MMSYMEPYGTPGNPPLSGWQKSYMDIMGGKPSVAQFGINALTSAVEGTMAGVPGVGALGAMASKSHAMDYANLGDAAFSPDKMSYDSSAASGLSSTGQTSGGGDAFENTPFYGTESQADLSQYQGWGILSPDRIGQSEQLAQEAAKRRALSGATVALERYNPIYWTKSKTK